MNIKQKIKESIHVKQTILHDDNILLEIEAAAKACVKALQEGKKILFCGNGGSAADAQHLAAELSGRFYKDRAALYAEALHVNGSYLTAVANDYHYDEIYARAIQAKGRTGDVLISISTSGNSKNIIKAMIAAGKLDMTNIGLTGKTKGKMENLADILINVPSIDTPRIQEAHILIGHLICEYIENEMFD